MRAQTAMAAEIGAMSFMMSSMKVERERNEVLCRKQVGEWKLEKVVGLIAARRDAIEELIWDGIRCWLNNCMWIAKQ